MHQKKSEVQIGTESSGVSSDFNPTPPLPPSSLTQKHPHLSQNSHPCPPPPSGLNPSLQILINEENQQQLDQNDPFALKPPTPFKRPHLQQQFSSSLPKTPTLSNALHRYSGLPSPNPPPKFNIFYNRSQKFLTHFHHHLRHLRRRLRVHLRLILLLSLPFFYFLVSHPSSSFLLDFLSAFAFSAVLLFSLNLAIPRLPTIRLFLSRSLPIKVSAKDHASRPHLPVFWSIGSRQKADKKVISGCYVQAYSNGDVYEGEFHKGKCSGSGVYYYYMSGRYEGDWVDGKYDGFGVETWARGSRYRGQYRQGLRHGFGVYRFYTGDVYAGEWSSGQSHGCGIHTCEDGSRYVGEFKWGVKHGLGHYHFREYFKNLLFIDIDILQYPCVCGLPYGDNLPHLCFSCLYYSVKPRCLVCSLLYTWYEVECSAAANFSRNGDRYAGEYFADKMHGFGVYYFANGHRYEGAWHEGRRQGLGMYTFRNGETQSGHWQNGILDVPSTQGTVFPVSPVAVNHSKVLNGVQVNDFLQKFYYSCVVHEARRAAEKAYEVAKVDERVNRAVAAANRSANAARVAAVKAVQKQMHHRTNSDDIPTPVVR
ncbi:phosphatidylinositol-4-phosphate 5-kinase family protein [Striga asiatica]|uniref:Phosphatidylinositol-4-phosphate 5-kinase family protein n=1 Tax=Striga asiatica TaxID=4170 RepID=A0A5A7QDZ2_STRAF|nr:phosphatidylinositol-4-phosphate 5-kinase family protein [Striga asiatica]